MKIATIFATIIFLIVVTVAFVRGVEFTQGCYGYLERGANSNTVELAERSLTTAVDFLNQRGLTTGYTSVVYRTPDEDIGFFYENLTAALEELRSVPSEATQLERSNVLMKLRETLTVDGSDGEKLIVPDGLSRYPHNGKFALFGLLSFVAAGIGWMVVGSDPRSRW